MNLSLTISHLLDRQFAERIGWTLLHFVWQGLVAAIVLKIVLSVLQRSSANLRYLTACVGLLAMALLPIWTYYSLQGRVPDFVRGRALATDSPAKPGLKDDSTTSIALNRPIGAVGQAGEHPSIAQPETPALDGLATANSIPKSQSASPLVRCHRALQPWLPSITTLWLIGVALLSVRLSLTYRHVHTLVATGTAPIDENLASVVKQLSQRLGVKRMVQLFESTLVEVPTLIGWLKPVILLPVASVTSLSMGQLEAILAHELAHVRRCDYVVNVLQSLVEILLFYHPAIWWLSARIREERENCCDDLAAAISGDAAEYAAALVRMEELRSAPRELALAARGGDLLGRVRRLLKPTANTQGSARWLGGTLGLLTLAIVIVAPLAFQSQPSPVLADDKKVSPVTPKKERVTAVVALDALDGALLKELTPAQIADKIEEAWKRYEHVEYVAKINLVRNTSAFDLNPKPILVKGQGLVIFRNDRDRWFVDEASFSFRHGQPGTYPTQTISAFDGSTHYASDGSRLVLGEEDLTHSRFSPKDFFWQAGLSAEWLLSALRRPEAKLVETIETSETTCLHVISKWTPAGDSKIREFDMMICPEHGWLPRRVVIMRGDDVLVESSIPKVEKTASGLSYPAEIRIKRPDTDNTPMQNASITEFRERESFTDEEFVVPAQPGMDIVDRRQGIAWHNDPWWNEMAPWIRENLVWPIADMWALNDLGSNCDPKMFGTMAPPLQPGEWLSDPLPNQWDRPDRKLTIIYFFGGRLIQPSPAQLKALDILYQQYKAHGVEVIGIATHADDAALIRQTVKELRLSFPVFVDSKASEADRTARVAGASWGATFVAFQQAIYSGVLLVDADGQIVQLNLVRPASPPKVSQVEMQILETLKRNGISGSSLRRRVEVNRASRVLRGNDATLDELEAAVRDATPQWLQNAQQNIAASMPDAEREFFKAHGLTIQSTLKQLNDEPFRLTSAAIARIEEEWKRRVAANNSQARITIEVVKETPDGSSGCPATIELAPLLRVLYSNTASTFMAIGDQTRRQTLMTDQTGNLRLGSLPKGEYELTISAPGLARTRRTVFLVANTSHVDLKISFDQSDSITGVIVDSDGKPIPNASIKAEGRYADKAHPNWMTTENLPRQPSTSNQGGEFVFDSLFDGLYVFEVKADGFETMTTEKIPAGTVGTKIVLKPVQ